MTANKTTAHETEVSTDRESDSRDTEREWGSEFGGGEAGGGCVHAVTEHSALRLRPDDIEGGEVLVLDGAEKIELSISLTREGAGPNEEIVATAQLDSEAAGAIGEALIEADQVEHDRAERGVPNAVPSYIKDGE